jgi:mannose-1-phosphate guanylyltransferase/mannose-6-phosphate isomerase
MRAGAMTRIVPVIMCGGAGTRLWPASRHSRPKQFLPLLGERSLFQETLLRVDDATLFARPLCITNEEYRFVVAEQVRELGFEADIVLEPVRRDSAPALAAACVLARQQADDAVVLALPADHGIADTDGFRAAVRRGLGAAQAGHIVTFGARPDHPATGYGYIAPAAASVGDGGARRVERFIEKPTIEDARRYIASGYLWNTGNFLASAATLLDEFARHAAPVRAAAEQAVAAARRDLDFLRLDPASFEAAPAISIDYAVMEKTDRAAVVEASFDWSDIGSWAALWANSDRDPHGNVAHGNVKIVDGSGNYVRSDGVLTVVVGVEDLVCVVTRDAVMVVPRERVEEVRQVVRTLGAAGCEEVTTHARAFRPWGHFEAIDRGPRYQVKRITVLAGGSLSLQKHAHRSEHWVVVNGEARVTIDGDCKTVRPNESVYIPKGAVHRLENRGSEALELIEVQSGDYLGEDDIVRLDDAYGRQAG